MTPTLALALALHFGTPQEALRPQSHVTDIAVSEEFAERVGDDLKASLVRGLHTRDWRLVESALADGFGARLPSPALTRHGTTDGVEILDWPGEEREVVTAEEALERLRGWLADWVAVDRAALKLHRFFLATDRHHAHGAAHILVAGRMRAGGRTELHLEVELELLQQGLGPWRIEELRFLDGHRVTSSSAGFRDISDETGFHFNESANHRAFNQSLIDDRHLLTVGGVSALDWNRDGFWDLLATLEDQLTVLFLNDGSGGFIRAPLPISVPEDAGKVFLYLDLDGDGREELVGGKVLGDGAERARFDLFTRRGGEWQRVQNALRFAIPPGVSRFDVQGIDAGDVDGDGLLDLFFAVRSDSRSGGEQFNRFVSHDGGDNLLFLNQGDLTFEEVSDQRGITGTQYTFIGRFFDFDQDGDVDLFEGNDFGPNHLYMNDGSGHFAVDPAHPLSDVASYTMGFTLADFDNTGDWNIHLSNMYSHAGNRIVPLAAGLNPEIHERVAVIGEGNQIYTRDGASGRWKEHGRELRVHDSGWAWASIFFDLENDGDKDLFVTNGYTSNSDPDAPDW